MHAEFTEGEDLVDHLLREFCAAVDGRGQFCFEAVRACVSGGGRLCAREASGEGDRGGNAGEEAHGIGAEG